MSSMDDVDRLRTDIATAFDVPQEWLTGNGSEASAVPDYFVGQIMDAIDEDLRAARYALQVGGSGSWSEPHSGVLCLDGVEGMDGLIPLGDQRLVGHMVRQQPQSVIHGKVQGALELLDLHKPNESGSGCVICARADESCGCVSAPDDSWPCETVVAVGRMFGVEYVPRPAPEPVEPDLDVLRAALAWDDTYGRALLDFERYPEMTASGPGFSGLWLTREQRINIAAWRPVWQKIMRESWDTLLHDFVESTPLPDVPSPLELATRTAEVRQAALDKARFALNPDVARMAMEEGKPRPGMVEIVTSEADFRDDKVTMKVIWHP